MITQVCNLSCVGCTNYSDLPHKGYVPWSQGREWLQSWLARIDIQEFGIMGGEPLINPEWRAWLQGCRDLMPAAPLRFTTNGLLLNKHPDIIDFVTDIGNVVFKITVHLFDKELESIIERIKQAHAWEPVYEHGIHRWLGPNKTRFQINRPHTFVKTYQNDYPNMRPWHSDPQKAFKFCVQQTCPLLYQGRIYKCSTAGLLSDTLARFQNPNLAEWQPYIPQGIGTDSDLSLIQEFIENFGHASSICGQCPSQQAQDHIIMHRDHNVSIK